MRLQGFESLPNFWHVLARGVRKPKYDVLSKCFAWNIEDKEAIPGKALVVHVRSVLICACGGFNFCF